jgi:hypothetical protein
MEYTNGYDELQAVASEFELVELLTEVLHYTGDCSVESFARAGFLTRDKGFVVKLANGYKFEVTVVKSDGPDDEEDEDY